MVGSVLKRLAARWPQLLCRIKAEDCHLTVRPLPQGVKVNSTFVDLNYRALSPFADPLLVYQVRGDDLLLWFIRQAEDATPILVIPEGILLARSRQATSVPEIIIYRQQDRVEITVVDQGWVIAQVLCSSSDEANLKRTLALLKREHGLNSPVVRDVSALEHQRELDQGLENIGLKDLPGFTRASQGDWQQSVLARSATLLPVVLAGLILFTAMQLGGAWMVERKVERLQDEFAVLQQELRPLLDKRNFIETQLAFWQRFTDKELQYPSLAQVYSRVAGVVAKDGGQLKRFNGSKGRVQVTVILEDCAQLADNLRTLPDFHQVRFEGPVRKERKTGLQQAVLACELKKK